MSRLLPYLLILYFLIPVSAQNTRIESLTVADGLSQGFVTCLFQCKRGFIWIGTFYGLNRYDGYRIRRYTPENSKPWSLKAGHVLCISEDAKGLIWLGTDKGLVVMDPYSERFVMLGEQVNDNPQGEVPGILHGNDGKVWFLYGGQTSGSGVAVVTPPADLIRTIRNSGNLEGIIRAQLVHPDNNMTTSFKRMFMVNDSMPVLIGHDHKMYRADPATMHLKPVALPEIEMERYGNAGVCYSPGKQKGHLISLHEGDSTHAVSEQFWPAFLQLSDGSKVFHRPRDKCLYSSGERSIFKEPPHIRSQAFFGQLDTFAVLDQPLSSAAMVDHSGNIWAGTIGYGVRKISRSALPYRHYCPDKSFRNLVLLPDGRIWPGIYHAFNVLNLQTGQLETAPWKKDLRNTWVYNLLVTHSAAWWIAGVRNDNMVVACKKENGPWEEIPLHLPYRRDVPVPLLEDSRGDIWIAGNTGQLMRIQPEDRKHETWDLSALFLDKGYQYRSTALAEINDSTLLAGTNLGLIEIRRTGAQFRFQVIRRPGNDALLFGSDYILSIFPDPENRQYVWLGTMGGGLIHFNLRTLDSESYTEQDGLSDNVVYGILPDKRGNLWLSTNRGLSAFDPGSRRFFRFENRFPPFNIEFNSGGYCLLPSGEMAFGSTQGLFVIDVLARDAPSAILPALVTRIKVNGKPLSPLAADRWLALTDSNTFSLHLPERSNSVSFEFAAPLASDPALVHYRYRLAGLHDHWEDNGNHTIVDLAAIPPGSYVFELQASLEDDDWDAAPVTCVYIDIGTPWYRGCTAFTCYAILVSVSIGLYLYRRKQVNSGAVNDTVADETIADPGDAFLDRLYAVFERNYHNEAYGLSQLCYDLKISRSQLQRRLAVICDKSAMQLLRQYRLKKAYEILMEKPGQSVKEVCFRVGFKNPSHFSRLFSQTFGVAPSDIHKKI